MKNVVLLALLACLAFGCAPPASQGDQYGEAPTLSEITPISSILENPDAHLGKMVLVEGKVLNVCEMRGCWMELAGDQPFQTLRVKVDDGVIVFPMTAQGKTARAQGELYKIDMTVEQHRAYLAHQAEERGEPFDTTTVNDPLTLYQIKGSGALVTP